MRRLRLTQNVTIQITASNIAPVFVGYGVSEELLQKLQVRLFRVRWRERVVTVAGRSDHVSPAGVTRTSLVARPSADQVQVGDDRVQVCGSSAPGRRLRLPVSSVASRRHVRSDDIRTLVHRRTTLNSSDF